MAYYITYLKDEKLYTNANKDKVYLVTNMIDSYMGTCFTLSEDDEEWLIKYNMLEYFYKDMFLCDGCGWYCEIYEQQENEECLDCNI